MPVPDRIQFKIHGMDCAEEVAILQRELGSLVGGEQNLIFRRAPGSAELTGFRQDASVIMDAVQGQECAPNCGKSRSSSARHIAGVERQNDCNCR